MPQRDRAERSGVETVARETAKHALHAWGLATASARAHPDFLLIGAKRGGTTSLWEYLSEHPDVLPLFPRPEHRKGMYYFDEQFGRGDRWYRSHFPTRAHDATVRSHGALPPWSARPRPTTCTTRSHRRAPGRSCPRAHPRRAARPGGARVLALQGAVRERHRAAVVRRRGRRGARAARGRGRAHRRRAGLRELRSSPLLVRGPGSVRADARALVRGLRARARPRGDQRGDVRGPPGHVRPRHGPPRHPAARAPRHPSAQRGAGTATSIPPRARAWASCSPRTSRATEDLLGRALPWSRPATRRAG